MDASSILADIARGRTDRVTDLLVHGDAALTVTCEGATALQWCAYYGDVTALRMLFSRGASLKELGDDLGLNAAAFHGHWQLCQFLLEQGADVNMPLPDTGETPLHSALVSEDRTKYDLVVRVLLAAGADVHALTRPNARTGSFMRDAKTKGETPLHRAAAFGTAETIHLLLSAGADRSEGDEFGDSPLAWASWYRRPVEILRLLCYGAHKIHPEYRSMSRNLMGDPPGDE
jgi:ankyrin repeat protein